MWEIPGVEYVYSYASNGYGMTTVRFFVGTDPEYALVRLYSKVMSEYHRMPIGAMNPIIIKCLPYFTSPIGRINQKSEYFISCWRF